MRVTQLALCLVLAACGGSKKPATMPAETTAPAPTGGEPAEGKAPAAEPVESTAAHPAMAPGGAPAPAAASAPAPAPEAKPVTRGAKPKTKKSEDPDAGGE